MEEISSERKRIQKEIEKLKALDVSLSMKQLQLSSSKASHDQFWGKDKVALASYPRSGNSYLRILIEKLTNTLTGSDGNPERSLVKQLAQLFRGEGKMDSTEVWCVKTHYPERVGRARLTCSRFILLVRNPFDCIFSFFQMMISDSHSTSLTMEQMQEEKFAKLWNDFLLEEVSIWTQFYSHWRSISSKSTTDKYIVLRYEDLTSLVTEKRQAEISRLAHFLYRDFLTPSEVEAKLRKFHALPRNTLGLYPLKPASCTGMFKSLSFYSNAQLQHVLFATRSDLVRFEYWDLACKAYEERTGMRIDSVKYVDLMVDECMVVQPYSMDKYLWLNSRYALRPRFDLDPYGRGFDVRWEERMKELGIDHN